MENLHYNRLMEDYLKAILRIIFNIDMMYFLKQKKLFIKEIGQMVYNMDKGQKLIKKGKN